MLLADFKLELFCYICENARKVVERPPRPLCALSRLGTASDNLRWSEATLPWAKTMGPMSRGRPVPGPKAIY